MCSDWDGLVTESEMIKRAYMSMIDVVMQEDDPWWNGRLEWRMRGLEKASTEIDRDSCHGYLFWGELGT